MEKHVYEQFWKQCFDYKSPTARRDYLVAQVYIFVVLVPFIAGAALLDTSGSVVFNLVWSLCTFLVAIAHLPPSIALTFRRVIDIGMNRWFALVCFIPYIGSLFLLMCCILPSKKRS